MCKIDRTVVVGMILDAKDNKIHTLFQVLSKHKLVYAVFAVFDGNFNSTHPTRF